jgi:hypothetical protein
MHKSCLVEWLTDTPNDPNEERFDEIIAKESVGRGLLAALERSTESAET